MPPRSKPSVQKRQTIKQTLRATHARRRGQICRVYQLKVTRNKLRRATRAHLRRLFLEAKWFTNWVLSCPDLFAIDIAAGLHGNTLIDHNYIHNCADGITCGAVATAFITDNFIMTTNAAGSAIVHGDGNMLIANHVVEAGAASVISIGST